MKQNDLKEDLKKYRMGNLTVLQLMGLLAILGLAMTIALHYLLAT